MLLLPRAPRSLVLLAGLLAVPPPAALAEEIVTTSELLLATQPEELRRRLLEERVVLMQEISDTGDDSTGWIVGLVIFDQPIERSYAFLSMTERQTEFRDELISVETIGQGASGPIDVHRIKVLFTRYAYHLEYTLDPVKHHIRYALARGFENDLRRVSGFWELYPMGERRTLGRFGTSVDVGPALPGWIQDWITREKVPTALERTRRWVDAEGRS